MKASDYIVSFFELHKIDFVFGYQGGMITHLIDSLSKSNVIKYIQCYHEQSAAIAAEGYARATGKFGVVISTSGPGATNMITGIANAYFDSIPVLYITGQVNTSEYKYNKNKRQQGFQETDIVSIVKPITKYAKMIDSVDDLQFELDKAVKIMMDGRNGAVLLDLPMNIQRSDLIINQNCEYYFVKDVMYDFDKIPMVIEKIKGAKKPFIIIGSGCLSKGALPFVNEFLQRTKIPCGVSLMGKGAVDESIENFLGLIGSYGNRCANIVFSEADVVLVLGSRLDLRQTGNVRSDSLKKILFIHVDIDKAEMEESDIVNKLNLCMSVEKFINNVLNLEISLSLEWVKYYKKIKEIFSQTNDVNLYAKNRFPYDMITKVSDLSNDRSIFTVDIGQNQMWAAQSIRLKPLQSFFTSGGLAPMGYALPAAVGAAFARPDVSVICIVGDGGFHISLQSLMLISQYSLNVSIFVFNNKALGLIAQFQRLYFNANMIGSTNEGGYNVPNIEYVAKSYNLGYKRIADLASLANLKITPRVIYEVVLDGMTEVIPKLEFDQPLFNMWPYLNDDQKKLTR